LDSKKKIK